MGPVAIYGQRILDREQLMNGSGIGAWLVSLRNNKVGVAKGE